MAAQVTLSQNGTEINKDNPLFIKLKDGNSLIGESGLYSLDTDLLTNQNYGWFDASNFQSATIQIMTSGAITSGKIFFEQTNDNTNLIGFPLLAVESDAINSNPINNEISIYTNKIFKLSISSKYIRVRISSEFVNGTLQAIGFFSCFPFASNIVNVQQNTADNLKVTASFSPGQNIDSITSANLGTNSFVRDISSNAITTTTTTGAITPNFGCSYQISIPVTIVTGTSPTMDISIQESDDDGVNWFTVYSFTRIVASGIYRSPKLNLRGNKIRYVQTIGGTNPSFTRSIIRLQSNSPATSSISQLVDRSIVLSTLNSTTPFLNVQNCQNIQLLVNIGAVTTTAPSLQLEGSDDNGLSWTQIGFTLTAVASSSTIIRQPDVNFQLIRAKVSTAGVGVTPGYVLLKGF